MRGNILGLFIRPAMFVHLGAVQKLPPSTARPFNPSPLSRCVLSHVIWTGDLSMVRQALDLGDESCLLACIAIGLVLKGPPTAPITSLFGRGQSRRGIIIGTVERRRARAEAVKSEFRAAHR